MSKRVAEYQLTKDNFDQEDNSETNNKNNKQSHIANEEVLKSRNILKAKRRNIESISTIFNEFKGFISKNNDNGFPSTKPELNFTSNSTTSNSNALSLFSFSKDKNSADSKCDTKDDKKNLDHNKKLNTAPLNIVNSVPETKNDLKKDIQIVEDNGKPNEGTNYIRNSYFLANLRKLNTNFVEHIQRYSSNPKCVYDYTLVCEEYVKKFKEIKEMCTENSLKIGIDKKDNEEVEVNNKVNKGNDVNEDKKQNSLNSDSKLPTFSQTSTKALFDSNLMKKLDDSDNSTAKESESEKSASLFSFGSSTFTKKLNTEFKFNDFNKNISNACSFPLKNMFPLNKNTESLAEPGKEENEDKSGETEEEVPPKTESIEHKESDSLYTKKCKLFYKKDNNFVEKGIGYLYIKRTNEERGQLLIRADTNLGNILLNIALIDSLPISKADKNKGVLLTCVPNPPIEPKKNDSEDKNTVTFLIRVKVADCDELYQNLLKYRK